MSNLMSLSSFHKPRSLQTLDESTWHSHALVSDLLVLTKSHLVRTGETMQVWIPLLSEGTILPRNLPLIHSSISSCHTVFRLLKVVFLNVPWSWWSDCPLIGTIKVIRQEPPQLLLRVSQLSHTLIHFPPLSYYNGVGISSNSAILHLTHFPGLILLLNS